MTTPELARYGVRMICTDMPESVLFPLGRSVPSFDGRRSVTYITAPQDYVFIGVRSDEINLLGDVEPSLANEAESIRCWVAETLGIGLSDAIPKIGLVAASSPDVDLQFRTRVGKANGWHKGAPGSGLFTLVHAVMHPMTVPHALAASNAMATTELRINTPAGVRSVELGTGATGSYLGITVTVRFTRSENQ